ncbi:competence type IV pilus ATPase ComGA [Cytobacillus sp. FSL W7-1323]|uniref:competence type IV pilus ATPase ComGA n=2 Tax=Cytobacillus sp. FSL W7-1323 TaxID=2921700 RepID=UPI00315831A1
MVSMQRMATLILREAVKTEVTDIHFVPRKNHTIIYFRYGKRLVPKHYIPHYESDRLISHFKFIASMDIGEKRKPQNGAYSTDIEGYEIGLRFSTLPSQYNESLVIRILPQSSHISSHNVSLFPTMSRKILAMLKHAHGMIILTGPTGSGKTSTLYSLLNDNSNLFNRSIITLEDPIEKKTDSLLQVEVNEKAGVTYATGLKAILRHDPDIIMVGEIRDAQTAKIAVRAALTGHLVLTTMHTRNSVGAIHRLVEFGVAWKQIEQTLVAITAQRLVELTCPFCEGECTDFCYSCGRLKRAGVFELLSGRELNQALKAAKSSENNYEPYFSLKSALKKGVALGYVKESEFNRWILDEKS